MNKNLALARPDILTLQPYVHALWDPSMERLHANENPWRAAGDNSTAGLNRYPESPSRALHERLAELYGVRVEQVLAGRGSDEGIDLLVRSFCRAGQDSVIVCPPTFGFYKVAATVQGAEVIQVPLVKEQGFALDYDAILTACSNKVKLVFLCSPNNPTGNAPDAAKMQALCRALDGRALVVIDEAYIEFAERDSFVELLPQHPNLVVLRTLSKAYALAGVRCGTVIADQDLIALLARVIPPYAIPTPAVESVLAATAPEQRTAIVQKIQTLIAERNKLAGELAKLPLIRRVWPSDANFLLIECVDADRVFAAAQSVGLILRDQRSQRELANCLRISVGTPEQNERLLRGLHAAQGAAA